MTGFLNIGNNYNLIHGDLHDTKEKIKEEVAIAATPLYDTYPF